MKSSTPSMFGQNKMMCMDRLYQHDLTQFLSMANDKIACTEKMVSYKLLLSKSN